MNPAGTAFLYLGYSDKISMFNKTLTNIEKTCLEECRFNEKEQFNTICEFIPNKRFGEISILNLAFEEISYESLEKNISNDILDLSNKIILKLSKNKCHSEKLNKVITQEILNYKNKIKKTAYINYTKMILKIIESSIFQPVDDFNENLKDIIYSRFHFFTKYLIKKGYGGVIFKSTRMELLGLSGKNVVLFNKDYAIPKENTMKVFQFERNGNHKIIKKDY